jgi:hypothetical protein
VGIVLAVYSQIMILSSNFDPWGQRAMFEPVFDCAAEE